MGETGNYYEVLGVAREADTATIRRAYRARARELHPDVSRQCDAEERFAELTRAYRVISRPTSRILYDRLGYLGPGNGGFGPAFESAPANGAAPAVGLAQVEVELLEAIRGATRRFAVTTFGTCTACAGSGAAPGTDVDECGTCEGRGRVRRTSESRSGHFLQLETCPDCGGAGRIVHVACDECGGTGKTEVEQSVKVRIPPGAEDGKLIRVEDEERAGDSRARDLYVVLRVLPDRDSRLVRYTAGAALALALVLFLVLALAPDSLTL